MELYLLIACIVLLVVILLVHLLKKSGKQDISGELENLRAFVKEEMLDTRRENRELNQENRQEINTLFKDLQDTLLKRIAENINLQKSQLDAFAKSLVDISDKMSTNFDTFKETIQSDAKENRKELKDGLSSFEEKFSTSIKEIRDAIEKQLLAIREDNTKQLNEMRKTVDEKLQDALEKRLGESFKQVSDRLELVHKGLGEMQTLATGVGDLKKVLSNVKTRGILGEYQLGNILEQLLSPEQYAENVATKKGSQAHVEFAIKLPGKIDEGEVWLPIDSKFPIENYQLLMDAYDTADTALIANAQKVLLRSIESFAKTISEKYIDPPNTTDFGIMFLPVESLYAEVLRHPGTFEKLQREYHITVTGPTTLSALLNSLQMGFRTLAVQKRSSEVWKVLGEVKTEFGKFSEHLKKVHEQVNRASTSLDTLRSTRANAMERKLRGVQSMDAIEAPEVIAFPDSENAEDD